MKDGRLGPQAGPVAAASKVSFDTMALTLVLDLSASLVMGLVDAGGKTVASRIREKARGESAHGLLDEILAEAGIGPEGIGAIAVGAGPGSFTGIRVAVAMAQGLAFARRLPLHPFSTLAALRLAAPGGEAQSVAAIAANAGRYYASSGVPALENLLALDELIACATLVEPIPGQTFPEGSTSVLLTYGPVPDLARLSEAFGAVLRLEDRIDFGAVATLALRNPPARDGAVRPNYLMASAAESKRLEAGVSAPVAGSTAAGSTAAGSTAAPGSP